jgi:hypothetical protein|tara:strand:- start:209 stop:559 length:351 start_codon:yes stop_codon:yes gene_type:complete
MSEETKAFIDKLADGDNASAGEAFKDALRSKVGSQLDQARKDMAGNLFNGNIEAEPHSDPKPEIADPGTFTKEGEVVPTTDAGKDGQAELDLSKPEDNGTPDTMVGVDVNAGEQNN